MVIGIILAFKLEAGEVFLSCVHIVNYILNLEHGPCLNWYFKGTHLKMWFFCFKLDERKMWRGHGSGNFCQSENFHATMSHNQVMTHFKFSSVLDLSFRYFKIYWKSLWENLYFGLDLKSVTFIESGRDTFHGLSDTNLVRLEFCFVKIIFMIRWYE